MRLRWPWRRDAPRGGGEAADARREAEQRLSEAEQQWPEVHAARDAFVTRVSRAFQARPS